MGYVGNLVAADNTHIRGGGALVKQGAALTFTINFFRISIINGLSHVLHNGRHRVGRVVTGGSLSHGTEGSHAEHCKGAQSG